MLRLMLHLRIMGENGILFVELKNLIKFKIFKKLSRGVSFQKKCPGYSGSSTDLAVNCLHLNAVTIELFTANTQTTEARVRL